MGTAKTKAKTKKKATAVKRDEARPVDKFFYATESVKNFDFADYVKIASNQRGMLLSFGKTHPETDAMMIVHEVFLPADVAFALKEILDGQIKLMMDKGQIRLEQVAEASIEESGE